MISREDMEEAIKKGGSVMLGQHVYTSMDELPSQSDMDAYVKARAEAIKAGDAVPQAPPPRTKEKPAQAQAPAEENGESAPKPAANPGARR